MEAEDYERGMRRAEGGESGESKENRPIDNSGGFRNLERGVRAPENFWVAMPTFGHINAFMTHVITVVSR